jgi:hypothetical protein
LLKGAHLRGSDRDFFKFSRRRLCARIARHRPSGQQDADNRYH